MSSSSWGAEQGQGAEFCEHPSQEGCQLLPPCPGYLQRPELVPALLPLLPALLQLLRQPGPVPLGLPQAGLQLLTLLVQAVQLLQQGVLLGLQGLHEEASLQGLQQLSAALLPALEPQGSGTVVTRGCGCS